MQAMPGPIDRGLPGADRIVTYTDGVAQHVEQEGQGRGSLIACRHLFVIHRQSNVGGIDNRGCCGHKYGPIGCLCAGFAGRAYPQEFRRPISGAHRPGVGLTKREVAG
jgi:hypothetical protein